MGDSTKNKIRQSERELLFDVEERMSLRSMPLEGSCDQSVMPQQPHRPWMVWFTKIVLAISSGIFGAVLIGGPLIYPDATAFKPQHFLLLVALPMAGLFGLVRRRLWGREAALLSLVSLWAFILQGFWSIYSENPLLAIRTPLTLSVFIFFIVLLTALPGLFAKLRWNAASREFFRV